MSFNIVDLIEDQISGQLMGHIGVLLGNQSNKIEQGISSVIPAILGGIAIKAMAPGGGDRLFGILVHQDDSILVNIGSLLGGKNSASIIDSGHSILSLLLGSSDFAKLTDTVADYTGLAKGNTNTLMGVFTPIILSVLKQKVCGSDVNSNDFLNILHSQKRNLTRAMPVGLSDKLQDTDLFKSYLDSASSSLQQATHSPTTATYMEK